MVLLMQLDYLNCLFLQVLRTFRPEFDTFVAMCMCAFLGSGPVDFSFLCTKIIPLWCSNFCIDPFYPKSLTSTCKPRNHV